MFVGGLEQTMLCCLEDYCSCQINQHHVKYPFGVMIYTVNADFQNKTLSISKRDYHMQKRDNYSINYGPKYTPRTYICRARELKYALPPPAPDSRR